MNKEVLSKYDVMSVAEGIGIQNKYCNDFVDADRNELNMLYHFDAIDIGYLPDEYKSLTEGYNLVEFKEIYSRWDSVFRTKAGEQFIWQS